MVVNEKGLLKAMKSAAKYGYHVFAEENGIVIFTQKWYVRIAAGKVPRSVLALLVEHIGFIPCAGDCMLVSAKEEAQSILRDVMDEEMRRWTFGNAAGEARMVPILYKGRQIFQMDNDRCYAVDPGALGLLTRYAAENGNCVVKDNCRMIWLGNDSRVILPVARPEDGDGDDEVISAWDALESVSWA